MSYLKKLNKKLKKKFNGGVEATEEGGLLLLSGELTRWRDVVKAGSMAVNKELYKGLVNDIKCTGERPSPPRMPALRDTGLQGAAPDVLIVGGGVIGCAIARELSRFKLNVMLVEKENDLAMQASGRNDGLVHSGANIEKGTLKYYYSKLGSQMFGDVCAELGVKFDRCGQFVCSNKPLSGLLMYLSLIFWKLRGIKGVKVAGRNKLRKSEPAIASSIGAALFFPATGIVCPYDLTLAYAENAVQNGAQVILNTFVRSIEAEDGLVKSVLTNRGTIFPKLIVNAAGAFCEDIAKMAGDRFYSIHPRKGTNAILDKKIGGAVVRTAVSSFGTASSGKDHTKGGGIVRTVDGNILVGPDAVETIEREDFSTIRQNVAATFKSQRRKSPALSEQHIINYFSGIRACTYEEDFVVCRGRSVKNMVHAAGIQSPGLTAAPAIGADVAKMVVGMFGGESVIESNPEFNPRREAPPRTASMSDSERASLIAKNPDYGVIICRCEEISKGEILDALRRSIPCNTIDGVKRRARPGMGRCQGGYCGPLVLDIISKEKSLTPRQVRKSGFGSELLLRPTKEAHKDG